MVGSQIRRLMSNHINKVEAANKPREWPVDGGERKTMIDVHILVRNICSV